MTRNEERGAGRNAAFLPARNARVLQARVPIVRLHLDEEGRNMLCRRGLVRLHTLAGLAALFLSGCSGGASSTPDKDAALGPSKDGKTDLGKPAFTLASKEFVAEFIKDQKAAQDKYKDKVVELTGKVVGFGANPDGVAFLTLEGPDPLKPDGAVCATTDSRPWKKAVPGQKVKIKGKVDSSTQGAHLRYCVVQSVSGEPAVRLTANALSREYATDIEAAKSKYRNKWIILSGEIEYIRDGGIVFKTPMHIPRIGAVFSPEDARRISSWKADDKVAVIGEFASVFMPDSVSLSRCQPVEDPK
jgi:tRNA_anti-like